MSSVIEVNAQNFKSEVLDSSAVVLVDFFAPWCGPCQMMAPVLDELAGELDGKVKVVKIDTDIAENQSLAVEYQIQSIPNLKIFKKGQVVGEIIGFQPKEVLIEKINHFLE